MFETSHQGGRKDNQDYFAHKQESDWSCFVVADGLGGHPKGEVISRYFCENVMDLVQDYASTLPLDPIDEMEKLIQSAHRKMSDKIIQEYGLLSCHTTFVLLWIDKEKAITAHIGDSRFYRVDENAIIWRTPDHTMVQKLFEEGKITEADFANHPEQNRLLRTVNLFEVPKPDIFVHSPLEEKEIMALCTDGFWTHMKAQEWLLLAKAKDKRANIVEKIDRIVREVPQADNITVQVIFL
jgi:serine/threonine protein phosphatase PrpC